VTPEKAPGEPPASDRSKPTLAHVNGTGTEVSDRVHLREILVISRTTGFPAQARSTCRERLCWSPRPNAAWSMIFSENRYPLFGIMLKTRKARHRVACRTRVAPI